MDFNTILRIVSYSAVVLLCASIPLRRKNLQKKTGSLLLPLSRKINKLYIAVLVLAPLLIFIQKLRDFELFYSIILDGTAVLGVEAVLRDVMYRAAHGVYEHALIVDGRLFMKDDIMAFPTLEYENSAASGTEIGSTTDAGDGFAADAAETAARTLQIVTRSGGTAFTGFANAQERAAAVEIVKNWI